MRNDFETMALAYQLDLTRSKLNQFEYENPTTRLAWKFYQAGRNNYVQQVQAVMYASNPDTWKGIKP